MKKILLATSAILLMTGINACTPTTHIRGNIVEDYRLAEVQAGVDMQSDVLRKLGSPTTKAPFDDNVWYYIGQETEKHGILDPKVVEERVIALSFDSTGTLIDIRDVDNARMDLPIERSKTPTSGHEITVMQQLLGNMGRFNKDGTP